MQGSQTVLPLRLDQRPVISWRWDVGIKHTLFTGKRNHVLVKPMLSKGLIEVPLLSRVQGITNKLQTVKPLDYYPLSMAYSSNASSKTSYLVKLRLSVGSYGLLIFCFHNPGHFRIQQEADAVQ